MGITAQQARSLMRNDRMKINSAGTIHSRTGPTKIVTINGTASVTKWRKDRKQTRKTFFEISGLPKGAPCGSSGLWITKDRNSIPFGFLIPLIHHTVLG
jgi:hypothetical protein